MSTTEGDSKQEGNGDEINRKQESGTCIRLMYTHPTWLLL